MLVLRAFCSLQISYVPPGVDSFCAAKARERPSLLADGNGLALRARPTSTKTWLLLYRRPATGKENFLSLGMSRPVAQNFPH
ncbi:Arm DNA-binding domain-containing protein [Paraburkholderia phenoliruptrix]|uniref:Arm DNA-binding domain-containing protein n=1 Tax=Paraburkholderia phenoliruptrix TaxID=252970 RepID=UPI0034CFE43C